MNGKSHQIVKTNTSVIYFFFLSLAVALIFWFFVFCFIFFSFLIDVIISVKILDACVVHNIKIYYICVLPNLLICISVFFPSLRLVQVIPSSESMFEFSSQRNFNYEPIIKNKIKIIKTKTKNLEH